MKLNFYPEGDGMGKMLSISLIMVIGGLCYAQDVVSTMLTRPSDWNDNVILSNPSTQGSNVLEVKGSKMLISKKMFKIDPAKTYKLSGTFKNSKSSTPSLVYFGFMPLDKNKKEINCCNINYLNGTDAELMADVNPNDTVIKIKNGFKWRSSPGYLIAFDTDPYPSRRDLPNRNISSTGIVKIEKKDNYYEVTLKTKVGKQYPAGTQIREHSDGGYLYVGWGELSDKWKTFSGIIKGKSKEDVSNEKWWPCTEYAQILILANWGKETATIQFKDITFEELTSF